MIGGTSSDANSLSASGRRNTFTFENLLSNMVAVSASIVPSSCTITRGTRPDSCINDRIVQYVIQRPILWDKICHSKSLLMAEEMGWMRFTKKTGKNLFFIYRYHPRGP